MAAEKVMVGTMGLRRRSRVNFRLGNLLAAILVAAIWSLWPALRSTVAALSLPHVDPDIVTKGSESVQLELQRSVQKHFLTYGVYLPLEDIMFSARLLESNKELEPALRRACGDSKFAVWLPLIVRFPLIGERSTEWCWKVTLKK